MKTNKIAINILTLSLILLFFFAVSGVIAAPTSYDIPTKIDISKKYLFYLHGTGIEKWGPNGSHPRWGRFDYHGVVKAFQNRGFIVISEVRPEGTDIADYAKKVVQQINSLLNAGVPPENINVLGFSKGGVIAMYVSAVIKSPKIKYIFAASCVYKGEFKPIYKKSLKEAAPSIMGFFLSIYDEKDPICGTCKQTFKAGTEDAKYTEMELKVGKGHATFFGPMDEWIDPVTNWIAKIDSKQN
jgi:predicted esterase